MSGRRRVPAQPRCAPLDPQVLRELQKALAVARCIRLATDYDEDDALDVPDAVAGLLILMEGAAALLDQPGGE